MRCRELSSPSSDQGSTECAVPCHPTGTKPTFLQNQAHAQINLSHTQSLCKHTPCAPSPWHFQPAPGTRSNLLRFVQWQPSKSKTGLPTGAKLGAKSTKQGRWGLGRAYLLLHAGRRLGAGHRGQSFAALFSSYRHISHLLQTGNKAKFHVTAARAWTRTTRGQ